MADVDLAALEKDHEASIATPEGKAFEMKATQAFFGDVGFMRQCVPPDADLPEPLIIYYEVQADGSLGALTISPQTDIAQCISAAISGRTFPYPPHRWIGKIELDFSG